MRWNILLFLLVGLLMLFSGCGMENQTIIPTATLIETPQTREVEPKPPGSITPTPTVVVTTTSDNPTITPTIQTEVSNCPIGVGLREETADYLLDNLAYKSLVMTGSSLMAEKYFPQFDDWQRVIGAPSLELIQAKADRALRNGVPYEALSYGLETSESTPDSEWQDLVASTEAFSRIAHQSGKLALIGPGMRLMSENQDLYQPMSILVDIWMLQTQRFQVNPPGEIYRQEVARIVPTLRTGNPGIQIWAQIIFPPDADPVSQRWVAYYESIADLVDGAYIGIYVWDNFDAVDLVHAVDEIFQSVCGGTN